MLDSPRGESFISGRSTAMLAGSAAHVSVARRCVCSVSVPGDQLRELVAAEGPGQLELVQPDALPLPLGRPRIRTST